MCHFNIFINITLAFSSKNSEYSNGTDEDMFGNKIRILRR